MYKKDFSFPDRQFHFLPYLFLFAGICVMFFTGCSLSASTPIQMTGFYFDTVISVTIYDSRSDEILSECMELASHYEQLLSPDIEGSDVWNINHSEGSYVTVSDDTLGLLKTALSYAALSDGLVDPTIGSLSQLWNFGSDSQSVIPEKTAIKNALDHIDYHMITIKDHQVMLSDPDARIELGFIAKGFIADKMT